MTTNLEPQAIMPLRFWCQKILPAVYDDSLSYYEAICKLADKVNEIVEIFNSEENDLTELEDAIQDLQDEFKKFKEHGFDDYYQQQVEDWINDNMEYIYTHTIKQVYFGLNEQGYFVAYIPESWRDIVFDTGMEYALDTYGRLILRWNVDNATETVNQTPEVQRFL